MMATDIDPIRGHRNNSLFPNDRTNHLHFGNCLKSNKGGYSPLERELLKVIILNRNCWKMESLSYAYLWQG